MLKILTLVTRTLLTDQDGNIAWSIQAVIPENIHKMELFTPDKPARSGIHTLYAA